MRALTFSVVVFTEDTRDEAERHHALTLSSMLNHQYGVDASTKRSRFEVHGPSGQWVYDQLAHDGHHAGHNEPLTLKPSLPNARGGSLS